MIPNHYINYFYYLIFQILGYAFGPFIAGALTFIPEGQIWKLKYNCFSCIGWYECVGSIILFILNNILFTRPDSQKVIPYNMHNSSLNSGFKEDLEDFLTDTVLITQLNIQVKGGNSSGEILDKYSYYGVLNTENAFYENIGLYDGETLIKQHSLIEPTDTNKLEDPNDFCIVVIEEQEFHMGEYTVMPRLYIYIPKSGEGIE